MRIRALAAVTALALFIASLGAGLIEPRSPWPLGLNLSGWIAFALAIAMGERRN